MADYTLRFRTDVDTRGIEGISRVVQEITSRTKISADEAALFKERLQEEARAGISLVQSLQDAARATGGFTASLRSGVKDLLDHANAFDKDQAAAQKWGQMQARAEQEYQRVLAQRAKQAAKTAAEEAAASGTGFNTRFAFRGIKDAIEGRQMGVFANVTDEFQTLKGPGLVIGGILATAAAAAGVVLHLSSEVAAYAREQEILAAKTGLTVEETQVFQRVADIAGVKTSVLTTGMRTLSKAMSESTAEGKLGKEALAELGLSAAVAFEAPGKAIEEIMAALAKVDNSWDRERIAIALFGRSGLEILPLIDHFTELADAVHRSGVVIETEGIKAAADYERQLKILGLGWQALKDTFGLGAVAIIKLVLEGAGVNGQPGGRTILEAAEDFGTGGIVGLLFPSFSTSKFTRDKKNDFAPLRFSGSSGPIDVHAEIMKNRAQEIDALLESGSGKFGQKTALDLQLAKAKDDLKLETRRAKEDESRDDSFVIKARDKVFAIEAQIEATKKLGTEQKKLEELGKRAAGVDENPLARFQREFADLLGPKATPGERAQYAIGFQREWDKQLTASEKRTGDFTAKVAEELLKIEQSIDSEFEKRIKDPNSAIGNIQRVIDRGLQNVPGPPGPNAAETAQLDKDIFSRASRRVQLLARPGDEVSTAQQILSLKVQELNADKEAADIKANAIDNEVTKNAELFHNKIEYDRQIYAAREDFENKLLELRKKKEQEFKSTFTEGVLAIQSGKFPDFLKQQGTKLETQVLGNVAGMIFNSKTFQSATSGFGFDPGSTMGKLFKGTFLDKADPALDFQSRTADATEGIYGVLTGQTATPGGLPIPGLPGGLRLPSTFGGGGLGSVFSLFGGNTAGLGGSNPFNGAVPGSTGTPASGDPFGKLMGAGLGSATSGTNPMAGTVLAGAFAPGATNSQIATSAILGAGVAIAGITSAVSDFKKGGARGIIGGIGDVAGTAAAFDPEPISKGILAGVALGSKLISSLFGDPKQMRADAINNRLLTDQFFKPVAINASATTGGFFSGYDRYGNVSTSNVSAFPQIQEPYADYSNKITVPGRVLNPFGGPSGFPGGNGNGPTLVYNPQISAMDGASVQNVLNSHLPVLMDAIGRGMMSGHGEQFVNALRQRG